MYYYVVLLYGKQVFYVLSNDGKSMLRYVTYIYIYMCVMCGATRIYIETNSYLIVKFFE
jgi:hypothetical protein